MEVYKPTVEVLVEGELSPFEHEALYQLLKKTFSVEHPSYVELSDENLATRVNIVFHHPYTSELFNSVLQENWRDLKEILRQVRRSEEHTSELQSRLHLVCRLLLEKKKKKTNTECR